jgi:hypothetical protein
MSFNINYSKFIGKDPHTQIHTANQMANQPDFTNQMLPCKGIHPDMKLGKLPDDYGAFKPNFGNQHLAKHGLAYNPQHPTRLPEMKQTNPYALSSS